MAIKPKCGMCGQELAEFGALLFGPPDKNRKVKKDHICANCYKRLKKPRG